MPVYEINNKQPVIGKGTWVAPSADIIGDVTIGENCYVGFNAVIRADFGSIFIGSETLVEENCVIHNAVRTEIGNRVIIGHMVMIHDAVIQDNCLIGMSSTICDHTLVGEGAILAEQSLVKTGQQIPAGKLYAGAPAKYVKDVMPHHIKRHNEGLEMYMKLIQSYHTGFKHVL